MAPEKKYWSIAHTPPPPTNNGAPLVASQNIFLKAAQQPACMVAFISHIPFDAQVDLSVYKMKNSENQMRVTNDDWSALNQWSSAGSAL